jgi:hypothetical protein
MSEYGKCRYDITLQPISGKAIPLYQGEVLRIIQAGGEQCVDFNCFNLHDYKERMSVGHMRVQGIRVGEGHIAVSAPPRYRPMLAVIHMSDTCVTDLIGARCDATAGEREYGLIKRTNCQDTLAEAIREYGLTPDDVHDSFNMWMHTIWNGSFFPIRNVGFKPIQCQVFEPSDHTREVTQRYLDQCTGFRNQRTRDDFRVKEIRKERKLSPIPGYKPRFRAFPIEWKEIEVEFNASELKAIRAQRGKMGKTDEQVVRSAFMLWYQSNRMKPHWIRPEGTGCLHGTT